MKRSQKFDPWICSGDIPANWQQATKQVRGCAIHVGRLLSLHQACLE